MVTSHLTCSVTFIIGWNVHASIQVVWTTIRERQGTRRWTAGSSIHGELTLWNNLRSQPAQDAHRAIMARLS